MGAGDIPSPTQRMNNVEMTMKDNLIRVHKDLGTVAKDIADTNKLVAELRERLDELEAYIYGV